MPTQDLFPRDVHEAHRAGRILLVDVREEEEHRSERIPGARLAALSTFDPASLPKEAPVVLYCVGGKRSGMALARCAAAGIPVAGHLAGGISAWKAAGLPTEGVR